VDDGVSRELDKNRLIALGNAVQPQQVYPIFKTIMEIERMMRAE
jgi:DNA (cytosine-5)-methyltransferase 1